MPRTEPIPSEAQSGSFEAGTWLDLARSSFQPVSMDSVVGGWIEGESFGNI